MGLGWAVALLQKGLFLVIRCVDEAELTKG
jgi:hypothetical protein